jgi:predicted ABC-type sugar transport system permease subunit
LGGFAVAALVFLMAKAMVWGRWIYAVGGDPKAALRMGIPVRAVLVSTYVFSVLCAGIGAVVFSGRTQAGSPLYGNLLARAIQNAGIANDKIVLVGFDFCCGEEEALKAGVEDATVAQFPAKMAEKGVDALVKAIRGEKVDSLIDSGAALVTKDNMAQFK